MSNYREDFLQEALLNIHNAGIKEIDTIKDAIIRALDNYELCERSTEIAVIDTENIQLIKRFLATKKIQGGSERTGETRWSVLRRFNEAVNKSFKEVDSVDILFWLNDQEKKVKLSTASNYRAILASFFSWMMQTKIITDDPTEAVPSIKVPNTLISSFSDVEVDALRNSCKSKLERATLEVLLSTGVRCAELCNLKWEDVNFVTKDVTVVEGKGRKSRVTMMDDVARKHLVAYRKSLKYESEYIFARRYRDEIINKTPKAISQMLTALGERSGVANVRPHRFRHTFATVRYKRGMDVHMIQRLLGHSNLNTTMRYIDSDLESLRDAYKRSV